MLSECTKLVNIVKEVSRERRESCENYDPKSRQCIRRYQREGRLVEVRMPEKNLELYCAFCPHYRKKLPSK